VVIQQLKIKTYNLEEVEEIQLLVIKMCKVLKREVHPKERMVTCSLVRLELLQLEFLQDQRKEYLSDSVKQVLLVVRLFKLTHL
jgi:hypothetical protein